MDLEFFLLSLSFILAVDLNMCQGSYLSCDISTQNEHNDCLSLTVYCFLHLVCVQYMCELLCLPIFINNSEINICLPGAKL